MTSPASSSFLSKFTLLSIIKSDKNGQKLASKNLFLMPKEIQGYRIASLEFKIFTKLTTMFVKQKPNTKS